MVKKIVSLTFLASLISIAVISQTQANEPTQLPVATDVPCLSKEMMFKIIEEVPKNFPAGAKDNVYVISRNKNGTLTTTIDGYMISYFDSRDPDSRKWGSVTNKLRGFGVVDDLEKIGCVTAGVNNYDTGKVDKSETALTTAQHRFNEYAQEVFEQVKK